MNFRLFFQLLIFEVLFLAGGFFALVFIFFLCFGSGAASSAEKWLLYEDVAVTALLSLPLLFGIIKHSHATDKKSAKSCLYAGLVVTIGSFVFYRLFG
ncbi:MAG: hypothetical protein CFE24_03840 [Flavobacterium sp. BFFFF2]|nr:MAG: hypothetical protein CFE24_03840 [Flavobacterium sp. BFFFF2]